MYKYKILDKLEEAIYHWKKVEENAQDAMTEVDANIRIEELKKIKEYIANLGGYYAEVF